MHAPGRLVAVCSGATSCRRSAEPRPETALEGQRPRCCRALAECRRRDSNPRHADYDSGLIWLNDREFEAGWTRRWTQPRLRPHAIPRVSARREQSSGYSMSKPIRSSRRARRRGAPLRTTLATSGSTGRAPGPMSSSPNASRAAVVLCASARIGVDGEGGVVLSPRGGFVVGQGLARHVVVAGASDGVAAGFPREEQRVEGHRWRALGSGWGGRERRCRAHRCRYLPAPTQARARSPRRRRRCAQASAPAPDPRYRHPRSARAADPWLHGPPRAISHLPTPGETPTTSRTATDDHGLVLL
jgi:hypothetical protein